MFVISRGESAMWKTMVVLIVATLFVGLGTSQTVAQPLLEQSFDPLVDTQYVTTYEPSLKAPKTSTVSKKRSLAKKRPAFWLDVYTVAFLSVSSITGVLLIAWAVNAKKEKTPRPLFQPPGYAPRISTANSHAKRTHAGSKPSRRVARTRRI